MDKVKTTVSVPLEDMELIIQMRKLQRKYFSTRDSSVLGRAKYLEGQVDKALVNIEKDLIELRKFLDASGGVSDTVQDALL